MYVWGILLHDFRKGEDGSKTLKQYTEIMDQAIFKDGVQVVRFDCIGENPYTIHSFCTSTPTS
jgi:hypothetical protein